MTLEEMTPGERGRIVALNFDECFCDRLRVMGFGENDAVECMCRAAVGSPVLYRAKGALVALRKCDCKNISVDNLF
ncbi:MAG: FeoA family protein [Eubacterium sp.]|nr:ferrous iron transport protein A [Oscillospiraceae bacterium]MDD6355956.1 FeoA family protein [Oscillospiraceae bacterium]MDY4607802.1 FeoA family protein [Eubacterium sp.]